MVCVYRDLPRGSAPAYRRGEGPGYPCAHPPETRDPCERLPTAAKQLPEAGVRGEGAGGVHSPYLPPPHPTHGTTDAGRVGVDPREIISSYTCLTKGYRSLRLQLIFCVKNRVEKYL